MHIIWSELQKGTSGTSLSHPMVITNIMPFGLTNAPAVYQALENNVLWDLLNQFVFIYLAAILIFSLDSETHQKHVFQVLQRLLKNQIYFKAENVNFTHLK